MHEHAAVVVATSDDVARELITRSFARAGLLTIPVASGEEVLVAARIPEVSLVVLDVELPTISGYETCYELRQEWGEELPIVFMSGTRTEPFDRVAGLLIGADDYLLKPLDPDELLVRARRLLRRHPGLRMEGDEPLTDRETEILRLLASGASQARISLELRISSKTVGTHIQRVLTKLGVHSRTEAVAFAFRHGWVPSDDAQELKRGEEGVRDVNRARRQRLEPSGAVPPEGLVAILPESPE
jgi:DNA-binding NarL/FixJ family response regulator